MSTADTVTLSLSGLSCAGCVRKVETALTGEPGVEDAAVNFATSTARVSGDALSAEALIAAIERAGFNAAVQDSTPDRRDREARARAEDTRTARRRVLIAAALTAPVFILEMGGHLIPGVHGLIETTIGHRASWAIQLVLTTLVLAGPGRVFFAQGVPALMRRAPEMNSLVALGAGAAWAYSVVVTLAPGLLPETARAVYFEAAAVIVTLILLGRYLEALAKGRTSAAIRSLLGLQPKTARLVRGEGVEDVPIEAVQPGDLIQLRPGDRAPVDGVVTEGGSYVDESMISGEPVPVQKSPGAEIIGGTVNTTGALVFRAERTGADTVLAQIIALVEEAQAAKLPIQALVDKVTGVFVPVVMGIAALTFLIWLIWGPARPHLRAGQCGRGADHRVSVRHGFGHADLDHGGRRARRGAGRVVSQGRCAAGAVRRARGRPGQDRHAHRRRAGADRSDRFGGVRRRARCCASPPRSSRTPNTPSPAPSSPPP
jgi:cation transport ATPase